MRRSTQALLVLGDPAFKFRDRNEHDATWTPTRPPTLSPFGTLTGVSSITPNMHQSHRTPATPSPSRPSHSGQTPHGDRAYIAFELVHQVTALVKDRRPYDVPNVTAIPLIAGNATTSRRSKPRRARR
jgi:hypothetical protein